MRFTWARWASLVAAIVVVAATMATVGSGRSAAAAAVSAAVPAAVPDGSRQVVTVQAAPGATSGTLTAWQRDVYGNWSKVQQVSGVRVGSRGIGPAREGSAYTPEGTFPLTESFGRGPNPGTAMPYFTAGPYDWWDGNVTSPTYNQHVVRSSSPGGASEHLYNTGAVYDLAVVIGANMNPTVSGGGSAFFLHITDGTPTAGCVGLPRAEMTRLIRWLDPRQSPVVQLTTGTAWTPQPVQRQPPQGDFDTWADNATGRIGVSGWVVDHANLYRHAQVAVRIDGVDKGLLTGNRPSPYLAPYGIPGNHAFFNAYVVGNGVHDVCLVAIGYDRAGIIFTDLGCKQVLVAADPAKHSPVGDASVLINSNGVLILGGYVFDPSDPYAPVQVAVIQNGQWDGAFLADAPEPSLAAYGVPGAHGINTVRWALDRSGAPVDVCLVAINIGAGANTILRCMRAFRI